MMLIMYHCKENPKILLKLLYNIFLIVYIYIVTNYTYEEGFTDNISTIKTYIDGCEETLIENTAYSYDENGNTIKTEDKINHTVEEKVYTEAGNGAEVLIRTYNNGVLTTTETEE